MLLVLWMHVFLTDIDIANKCVRTRVREPDHRTWRQPGALVVAGGCWWLLVIAASIKADLGPTCVMAGGSVEVAEGGATVRSTADLHF
jgi:hypothetical protein